MGGLGAPDRSTGSAGVATACAIASAPLPTQNWELLDAGSDVLNCFHCSGPTQGRVGAGYQVRQFMARTGRAAQRFRQLSG
jgi:hypothetical protein